MYKRLMFFAFSISAVSALYGSEGIFELGKIEVVGSNDNTGSSVSVIDAAQMQDFERKTVVDAVNMMSGVNVATAGARGEQMIMIRGFDYFHVPLMMDGIPIAVPYDGYASLSRFSTFDLSEIEVSKGLTSVLVGPNAFAGAINMVSKKPTKAFEGEIGAGIFSGNGQDGYIILGSNQGKYYITGSLSSTSRDNYPLSGNYQKTTYEDGGSRLNSYSRDVKINLKAAYTPNTKDEYSVSYIKQKADSGIAPYEYTTSNNFRRWENWEKESYYFLSKTDFDKWYVKTRLFSDSFKNQMDFFTDNKYTVVNGYQAPYDDNTVGGSIEAGLKLSERDSLKFAVHYKIDTHKKGGADSYGKTGPIYESQDSTSSYSSEYKKALTDSSILTVGAAYNSAKVSKANNENVSAIASYFANTGAGTSQAITNINKNAEFSHGSASSFDPMIKIDTKIDSTMSIYGGIAKKSRIPNLKDRYSTRLDRYIPNPDLSMESTINYEVGATKKFKDGSVKMSLFYAKAKDFIQAIAVNVYRTAALANANVASNRMLQNQNIGDVTQKGFEIEGSYIVSDKLSFDGSYTKLSMKNDTDSSKKITDVPSDKVVIASVYSPLSILTWTNSFEFDSRRLDTNGNSSNVEATWNTKAIYKATKALSLEAGVNNVLDRNYYVQYGYPEAGRVYYGNVKYKF